jgi:hypothetical protein
MRPFGARTGPSAWMVPDARIEIRPFAPVVVSEDATSAPAGAVLDIVAGAIRIAVHAGAPSALVEAVVRALQEPPRPRSSARP